MKVVRISKNEYNYRKDDGTYLLDEHVHQCLNFNKGLGIVLYNDNTFNYVNEEGKRLLKNNVLSCLYFDTEFSVEINNGVYYLIDKECNFYNLNSVSFKELYNKYPNKRNELIEIIDKYTYYDVNEYFNI